jgi:prepilin-type N-terminal cleavage/methylation domain-containing protein
MRRIVRSPPRPGEEGFTLLEVLVGLVIISLLGVGMWTAVAVAWRSVERFRESARTGSLVLELDDRFRSCAARVRPPWWGGEPELRADGHATWRISCLDGDPGKTLTLSWRNGVLAIDDGERIARYRGFTDVDLSPARDDTGMPFGVELSIEVEHLGRLTIVARYGGMVVRRGDA